MERRRLIKPALLSAFYLLLSSQVYAHPYPKDDLHDAGYSYLQPRACEQYCGADNQFCCGAGSACFTENGIAKCAGGQNLYTTTWTETNTFTSTVTTDWPEAAPTPVDKSVPCVPQKEGWTSCGWICCDYWQECAGDGQCRPRPGFEGGVDGETKTIVITTDGYTTTLYSAPFRVTSTTGTSDPTATFGGGHAEGQDDDSGLSGGAIAGIVIGTLAGIGLLFFICFCCVAKGIFGAIFGGGKKNKERTREEIYDERYTSRGGGSRAPSRFTRRGSHDSWYGGGGGSAGRDEKKAAGAKWLGIGALAATLLALLNIRKKKKPPSRAPTMYSDSYMYTDSSPSNSSSGGGSKHASRYSHRTGGRPHRSYNTHRTRQTGRGSSRRSSAL